MQDKSLLENSFITKTGLLDCWADDKLGINIGSHWLEVRKRQIGIFSESIQYLFLTFEESFLLTPILENSYQLLNPAFLSHAFMCKSTSTIFEGSFDDTSSSNPVKCLCQ